MEETTWKLKGTINIRKSLGRYRVWRINFAPKKLHVFWYGYAAFCKRLSCRIQLYSYFQSEGLIYSGHLPPQKTLKTDALELR